MKSVDLNETEGFSLIFVALSTAALGAIEKAKMTAAAGLYNVVRQVSGSVGIAVAATTLTTGIAAILVALASANIADAQIHNTTNGPNAVITNGTGAGASRMAGHVL